MTDKTYKFPYSRLLWKGDREPVSGELVYLLDRRFSNVTLGVVKVASNYDGGSSGHTFYKVYGLGPLDFHQGIPRVPHYDLEGLNHDTEFKARSHGVEIIPRSPEADSLMPIIVGLRHLFDEARSDHEKLEKSLARIFGKDLR